MQIIFHIFVKCFGRIWFLFWKQWQISWQSRFLNECFDDKKNNIVYDLDFFATYLSVYVIDGSKKNVHLILTYEWVLDDRENMPMYDSRA